MNFDIRPFSPDSHENKIMHIDHHITEAFSS
jgi:hypothetical protein